MRITRTNSYRFESTEANKECRQQSHLVIYISFLRVSDHQLYYSSWYRVYLHSYLNEAQISSTIPTPTPISTVTTVNSLVIRAG